MLKYRKLPVIVEAIQFTGNIEEVRRFLGYYDIDNMEVEQQVINPETNKIESIKVIEVEKLHSDINIDWIEIWNKEKECYVRCPLNHWIIKDINGEFYSRAPDVFKKTYEAIEDIK